MATLKTTRKKITKKANKSRPGAGRPSAEQQVQRHEDLLEVALNTFLEHGYEVTTIDQIALELGMSKRTVYTLYDDKAALFKAAVQRAIKHLTLSREVLEKLVTDDLRTTLTAITRMRTATQLTEKSLRLQRILYAQARQFPELGDVSFKNGSENILPLLSNLFSKHAARGEINIAQPKRTALTFLSIASMPLRKAMRGRKVSDSEVEDDIQFAIEIFFNGVTAR